MEELVKYLKAILAVQMHAGMEEDRRPKLELLLHNAGLTAREIGELLGKSEAATSKAITRARASAKGR